jgi:hypothetical protein
MLGKKSTATPMALTVALIMVFAGTACGDQTSGLVQKVVDEARKELYEEPIDLSKDGVDGDVRLTPDGDLLIDGKPVPMEAAQREAALAFRERLLAVADAGLLVGQEGAALGAEAAALALGAMFSGGDTEEAERQIEAEAEKMKGAAQTLCREALSLQLEQARFAEVVPEFAPYVSEIDVDADCEDDD